MNPIAAGLAERVPAEDEQSGDVEFLVELLLAMSAEHLTTNNRIISQIAITHHKARSSIP